MTEVAKGPAKGLKWYRWRRYGSAYHRGVHEPELQVVLSQLLRPDDVFYDVGAHIGFFSLLASRRTSAAVISIEPEAENVEALEALRDLNGVPADRWRVYQAAAAATVGTITFEKGPSSKTGKIAQEGEGGTVQAVTLDSIAVDTGQAPGVVKIDVEGFAEEVLEGAREVTAHDKPRYVIEVHHEGEADGVRRVLADYGWSTLDGTPLWDEGGSNRSALVYPFLALALPLETSTEGGHPPRNLMAP